MIKSGREEIIYLLNKCIEKYQLESGKEVIEETEGMVSTKTANTITKSYFTTFG
jgi:hypothetical protein